MKNDGMDFLLEVLGKYDFNEIVRQGLRFFFKNPYESLIIVDKNERVQFMDRGSEKFFGLEQGGAKGMCIKDLVPKSILSATMETGIPTVGRVFEVKEKNRISASYPLKREGEIIGGIGKIIFQSVEAIERINNEMQELKKQIHYFRQKERKEYASVYTFDNIMGRSASIRDAVESAKKISLLGADVLIFGESGTGKELFAHSIHNYVHAETPFVKVNCPAIPFELAESELFGYEKGAFTGALVSGRAGHFETANNGTIYLDEISSLPLSIQAKLLRVLEEREVERLGSTKTKKINFRIICATNVDLKYLVTEGKFRNDLYYRIAKATIRVPPLRDRRDDIPLYTHHFLQRINQAFTRHPQQISDTVMDTLVRYDWPGNVRELINVLEQTALEALDADAISEKHLPHDVRTYVSKSFGKQPDVQVVSIKQEMTKQERDFIQTTLRKVNGNKRKAARLLNMPRSTLYEKLKRYGIGLEEGKKKLEVI